MEVIRSKNGVPIRLTEERWIHITEEHSEMAGYYFEVLEAIQDPKAIYKGKEGELLATREIASSTKRQAKRMGLSLLLF
jgi:site-specific recombinase XerC